MSHSVLRHCRAAAASFVIAVSAANAAETAIFVPGWCRNGGDSAQELALLAETFPGARCEARTWEGDGVDFWACRDEADAEGRRFGKERQGFPPGPRIERAAASGIDRLPAAL